MMELKPAPEESSAKDCCKLIENIEQVFHENPDMIKTRCKKCGVNHYRLMAKSISFGASMSA